MPKEWEDGFEVTVRFKSNTHPETWFIEHLNSYLKKDGGSAVEWDDEFLKIIEVL